MSRHYGRHGKRSSVPPAWRPRIVTRMPDDTAEKIGAQDARPADIDRVVEIECLAAREPLDYEVAREAAARRLGLRTSVLDAEVRKKRRALGLDRGGDDEGQGRVVRIEDVLPWPEPVDGDLLATALTCAIKTYIVLPDDAANAIALWILHAWLVNDFAISPRLAVTSPTKGCGKTTVLNFLNHVVRRPKRSGSISPPALFRVVEMYQPTLLLDENEKYMEAGSDMHALLNEGHTKGATVMRVLGDKMELREFNVFGAVAFARNGRIPDDLEQRSIVIELHRAKAGEAVENLRPDRCEVLGRISRMAARWCEDHRHEVADIEPELHGLVNRAADNWRPLFAISEAIGGDWPERAVEAAKALAPRESESTGPMLLADIQGMFDTSRDIDRLSSADICEALAEIEGRPWAEWKSGKQITPNQLARLLKPFGIAPDTLRIGGRAAKGYQRHQFSEAWETYLAPAMPADTPRGVSEPLRRNKCHEIRTSGVFQTVTRDPNVTVAKCEKPLFDGLRYDVTYATGEAGGNGASCAQCGGSVGAMVYASVAGDDITIHPECQADYMRGDR